MEIIFITFIIWSLIPWHLLWSLYNTWALNYDIFFSMVLQSSIKRKIKSDIILKFPTRDSCISDTILPDVKYWRNHWHYFLETVTRRCSVKRVFYSNFVKNGIQCSSDKLHKPTLSSKIICTLLGNFIHAEKHPVIYKVKTLKQRNNLAKRKVKINSRIQRNCFEEAEATVFEPI